MMDKETIISRGDWVARIIRSFSAENSNGKKARGGKKKKKVLNKKGQLLIL